MNIRSITNLLPSRDDYSMLRYTWRGDITAGLTVGIVALPLALAFGVSSGVGAEAGLITAIVAGLIAAIFGGSNVQVSGPTGAMVVVLAPIVAQFGVGAVALLSLMAGLMVVIAGFLRLGRLISYIPWPVIEGFTMGIGIIILMQQIPAAVGNTGETSTNALVAAVQSVVRADWPAALVPAGFAAAVIVLMLVLEKLTPRIPSSFTAIVIVTVFSLIVPTGVATIGELPRSLPAPSLPAFDSALMASLVGPAFAVAALAAIESLLSARVAASMANTGPYNADRELVGQGLASIGAGLFGGMPATGAIARTAVNVRSGGRTRMAAVVHALFLVLVVYLAAPIVSIIPLSALSGVLIVTGARMVSPEVISRVMRSTRPDALIFVITAVITVSVDLVIAVIVGVVTAAFAILIKMSNASSVHREVLPGKAQEGDEQIGLFRIEGALFFGAAERILDTIQDYEGLSVVILRLSAVQMIDATGAHQLTELVNTLERRGVVVLIKGVKQEHIHVLGVLGVVSSLKHPSHVYEDLDEAVEHARAHVAGAFDKQPE